MSETTRARKLKLKTQLDCQTTGFEYKKNSARRYPGGAVPPNVILGPIISRKVLELKKLKLKTQLDIVKYSLCV